MKFISFDRIHFYQWIIKLLAILQFIAHLLRNIFILYANVAHITTKELTNAMKNLWKKSKKKKNQTNQRNEHTKFFIRQNKKGFA